MPPVSSLAKGTCRQWPKRGPGLRLHALPCCPPVPLAPCVGDTAAPSHGGLPSVPKGATSWKHAAMPAATASCVTPGPWQAGFMLTDSAARRRTQRSSCPAQPLGRRGETLPLRSSCPQSQSPLSRAARTYKPWAREGWGGGKGEGGAGPRAGMFSAGQWRHENVDQDGSSTARGKDLMAGRSLLRQVARQGGEGLPGKCPQRHRQANRTAVRHWHTCIVATATVRYCRYYYCGLSRALFQKVPHAGTPTSVHACCLQSPKSMSLALQ